MARAVADCERLRVLVVDDDRDAADSLSILVQLWGHDVLTEYDGASAYDGALSYRPHVVLLDIGLPKIDGYQLARAIRQAHGKEAILIAVTGFADEANRGRFEDAFDHYLVKPAPVAEIEALLALVKKTLKFSPRSASDTMQAATTFSLNETGDEQVPPPVSPATVQARPG